MQWEKDGVQLDPLKGLRKVDAEKTSIKLEKVQRGDKGKYECVLRNSQGEVRVPIELEVLDKPSAPEGPLKVSDVTNTFAVLSWLPPKDDGGSPIEAYVIEKMDVARGEWTPVDTVSGLANSCKVTKLTPKKEYKFRVRAVNKEGDSPHLETTHATLAKNPFDEPSAPTQPDITDWNPDKIDIAWKPPASDGGAPIEKYVVEKREKKGNWIKATEVSAGSNKATVGNLSEGKEYEFRVIAVNKAGPGEPSEPSRSQIAKPRFRKA